MHGPCRWLDQGDPRITPVRVWGVMLASGSEMYIYKPLSLYTSGSPPPSLGHLVGPRPLRIRRVPTPSLVHFKAPHDPPSDPSCDPHPNE